MIIFFLHAQHSSDRDFVDETFEETDPATVRQQMDEYKADIAALLGRSRPR